MAQAALPAGLRILFIEGYRLPALQRAYFEEYLGELRAGNPGASEQELFNAASRYVSPPDIAPHSAGAAVDLTLATDDGTEIDMGTQVNANPEDSGGACFTDADSISAETRANRGVLGRALAAAGTRQLPDRVVALVLRRSLLGARHRRGGGTLRPDQSRRNASRRACETATAVKCLSYRAWRRQKGWPTGSA